MPASRHPDELMEFPCLYEFKVFGETTDSGFYDAVFGAVNRVVAITPEALKVRVSSAGRYQCISVLVQVDNGTQLNGIYAMLRQVDGLSYLL
ncbi:MAG: DUF493 domain-containing protein [Deltaproteobacteria bacterium]|nr:MAG: DUF493 domain-containing protein [Deltaproteobacteria bacterium]